MKILQFTCADVELANTLKTLMTDQVNEWARLQWLVNDPNYITDAFKTAGWLVKKGTTDTYWIHYDGLYAALGESGQHISDVMLGDGDFEGVLLGKPLKPGLPILEMVEVSDFSGYLEAEQ